MQPAPDRFVLADRHHDPDTGQVQLNYQLGDQRFTETFAMPPGLSVAPSRQRALDHALDALHWIAGVSYFKAFCPPRFEASHRVPSKQQGRWLDQIYRQGLAEFAHRQGLDPDQFPTAPRRDQGTDRPNAEPLGLGSGVLLPLGGGKDSLVAWRRLADQGLEAATMTVQIGQAPLIQSLGETMVARGDVAKHWVIARRLDPKLMHLNEHGAMNGHVPITAINAAALSVLAILLDVHWVVFANERSADEPTLIDSHGRPVNHQFSKSFVFEQIWADWVAADIAADLKVFSILRARTELSIAQTFATMSAYHAEFCSCNRNFHIDPQKRGQTRWCGDCPKCRFVYLMLAVWMSPAELRAIFGADLLGQARSIDGFAQLLALDGRKPFECVGQADEARRAVLELSQSSHWRDHVVITALAPKLVSLAVPSLDALLAPSPPHALPVGLEP